MPLRWSFIVSVRHTHKLWAFTRWLNAPEGSRELFPSCQERASGQWLISNTVAGHTQKITFIIWTAKAQLKGIQPWIVKFYWHRQISIYLLHHNQCYTNTIYMNNFISPAIFDLEYIYSTCYFCFSSFSKTS